MTLSKNDIKKLLSQFPEFIEHSAANNKQDAELTYRYLSDGITNKNYWIKINNNEFVLRVDNPDSKRLGLDRLAEKMVLESVSKINLVPRTVFYNKDHNLRLSQWLPGTSWTKDTLEDEVNLNRLVKRLKQLHSLPASNLPMLNLLKRLKHYRLMIQQRHGQLPSIEKRLLSVVEDKFNKLQPGLADCLCHNDLLAANILDSKQEEICFLDWEYAAVNNPLFELAVICRGNQLSTTSQQYLIQTYLGEQTDQHIKLFHFWCWLYDYLSLLWGLVLLPEDNALPRSLKPTLHRLMESLPNS